MNILGTEPRERDDPTGLRRDLRMAAGLFAFGLVLYWLNLGQREPIEVDPQELLLIPLAMACAAAMFRRTAPLVAVVLLLAAFAVDQLLGPSLAGVLVLSSVLYDVARYARPVFSRWLLVVVSAVTVVYAAVVLVSDTRQGVGVSITIALILVLPVLTGAELRQYRDRAETERLRADQLERLAVLDRRQAVAAERTRMARELHDVIANHLSAISIHATGADAVAGDDLDPRVRGALRVIRENSVQGLAEMRQMIELLREPDDPGPDHRPRLEELDRLVAQARCAGLDVTVSLTGAAGGVDGPPLLPVEVDLAAYRIVQESLTNALKHAAGGRVEVSIEHRTDGLAVTVDSAASDPPAPPALPGSGVGLVGMRERVTLLGGAFSAGPHDGGFRVRAELPA